MLYEKMAPIESAPNQADCLTSIHYIFRKAIGVHVPLTLVGDMPRRLLSLGEWKFCKVDQKEAHCGDLLFAKRITDSKLIAHAALILDPNRIFHCRKDRGAVVETFEEFHSVFEQKLTYEQIRYIDPRNKEMRKQFNGSFIPSREILKK